MEVAVDTGAPLSAADLTLSCASALTAFDARANTPVKGWVAVGLVVPTVCGTNAGPTSTLTFQVYAETISVGKPFMYPCHLILTFAVVNVFVTGDMDAIGSWNPGKAIALSSEGYPIWKGTVTVPSNTKFQYKYHQEIRARIGRYLGVRSQSSRHDSSRGTEQHCPRLVAISEKNKSDWFVWRTVRYSHYLVSLQKIWHFLWTAGKLNISQ